MLESSSINQYIFLTFRSFPNCLHPLRRISRAKKLILKCSDITVKFQDFASFVTWCVCAWYSLDRLLAWSSTPVSFTSDLFSLILCHLLKSGTWILGYLNYFFFFFLLILFIYDLAALGLSCGTWDLVPWPGTEPLPPSLGAWSLSHWTTREVPNYFFFN